jgi:type IV secretory pathway VirB2 component (pilin)
MKKLNFRTLALAMVAVACAGLVSPELLFAGSAPGAETITTGLTYIINILQAVARPLSILLIIVGGFVWAFSRHEEGMKKVGQAFVGIAIALGAVALSEAFGFGGTAF